MFRRSMDASGVVAYRSAHIFLAGPRLDFLDFALLKNPKIDQTKSILLILLQGRNAPGDSFPTRIGRCNRCKLAVGKTVEQCETRGSVEGEYGLVLRVDNGQMWRELAQHGYGGGLIIYKDPRLAPGGNFPANNQRAVIRLI